MDYMGTLTTQSCSLHRPSAPEHNLVPVLYWHSPSLLIPAYPAAAMEHCHLPLHRLGPAAQVSPETWDFPQHRGEPGSRRIVCLYPHTSPVALCRLLERRELKCSGKRNTVLPAGSTPEVVWASPPRQRTATRSKDTKLLIACQSPWESLKEARVRFWLRKASPRCLKYTVNPALHRSYAETTAIPYFSEACDRAFTSPAACRTHSGLGIYFVCARKDPHTLSSALPHP